MKQMMAECPDPIPSACSPPDNISPHPCAEEELCDALVATSITDDRTNGQQASTRRRTRQKVPESTNTSKASAFAFVFCGKDLYVLRNYKNVVGVPGGKRDFSKKKGDKDLFETVRREFHEEVGIRMPSGKYSYFDWVDVSQNVIRYFCRVVTSEEAGVLPVGDLSVDRKEVSASWLPWEVELDRDKKQFRFHISRGLGFYRNLKKDPVYPDNFDGEFEF